MAGARRPRTASSRSAARSAARRTERRSRTPQQAIRTLGHGARSWRRRCYGCHLAPKEHAMNETLTARTEEAVRSPADVYDEQFVPALFSQWGPVLCDAADIAPGQ